MRYKLRYLYLGIAIWDASISIANILQQRYLWGVIMGVLAAVLFGMYESARNSGREQ